MCMKDGHIACIGNGVRKKKECGRVSKKRKTVTGNNNEATRLSDRFADGVQRNFK